MQQQRKNRDEQLWKLTKGYKQEYTPDVENGLAKLKGRIAKDALTPIVPMRSWLRKAASIAILVLGSAVLYQQFIATSGPAHQVLRTTDAVAAVYDLPDGSQIQLNKHSKISYPSTFADSERAIELEGEAYFQINSNPEKPFIIKTDEAVVRVLGTSFNVRAYAKEKEVAVSVEEGKVSFESLIAKEKVILQASEKGVYRKNNQELTKIEVKEISDFAWKEKHIAFDETPINEILSYLTTQFDVEFISSEDYSNCSSLTATLIENEPDAILKRITNSFPIQVKPMGTNKYQLSGRCE